MVSWLPLLTLLAVLVGGASTIRLGALVPIKTAPRAVPVVATTFMSAFYVVVAALSFLKAGDPTAYEMLRSLNVFSVMGAFMLFALMLAIHNKNMLLCGLSFPAFLATVACLLWTCGLSTGHMFFYSLQFAFAAASIVVVIALLTKSVKHRPQHLRR